MSGLLLILGLVLLVTALVLGRSTGIPWRRIAASDTIAWQRAEAPLISRRLGLVGRPDYLVREGRRLIPVEVKPGRHAEEPYRSDMMQLAAYCLLIEETTGRRPPYGILRYAEATFRIRYDDRLRSGLLSVLDEMREAEPGRAGRRSHTQGARCRACGFYEECDQAL